MATLAAVFISTCAALAVHPGAVVPHLRVPVATRGNLAMMPPRRGRGPPPPEHMINDKITADELRVVMPPEDPSQPDVVVGVMPRSEAIAKAQEEGVDLVCISPGANPPVCKIIDYGRFKFQLDKKKKMMKKATQSQALKEIKLSYTIESHDLNVRIRAAEKFLQQGNKVKAVVQFRGREMQHTAIGAQLLDRLSESLADYGSPDGPPKQSGNRMEMYITPKPKK
mmetsp:Transcript_20561/g.55390  ORF Transcript_20561/g.55390 Transcript_20561/m.55390 type:complete len:225 (-) Transcript_20561:328-1002(-)|eukprot:CAMPEP_0185190154 /NCGR_PEP_ID=MMETSP1140-20130426/6476_1 /TAXON_ID=298111 /ORGANISM="Pavlova sp., Strain CCMP459" /LENGTH=224 /DNA_ID=CAMNT_0027756759 /DNA_START=38 /DNA_END=712 /DNA_ORIENTATION=-